MQRRRYGERATLFQLLAALAQKRVTHKWVHRMAMLRGCAAPKGNLSQTPLRLVEYVCSNAGGVGERLKPAVLKTKCYNWLHYK
jgi:hypothetical protein